MEKETDFVSSFREVVSEGLSLGQRLDGERESALKRDPRIDQLDTRMLEVE